MSIALDHFKALNGRDRPLHGLAIQFPVRLRARSAHGMTLPPIEHPELDPGFIGDTSHQTVKGIDLPDKMPLSQSANGGIAGHHADRVGTVCNEGSPGAQTRGSRSRLTAGVTASNDDDIESIH
ncbi:hypothetical protein GGR23_004076 [Gellertiella hungarica]|uniref:Uncharacterized protein n=1 Tax=Gellertiella hungarica TaxID=1572859 RepID=A0A7W6NMQ2_9HYPH|nr:hypothetical protein [Gellertiella hungarica]